MSENVDKLFFAYEESPPYPPRQQTWSQRNCNTTLQTELNILKQAFGGD